MDLKKLVLPYIHHIPVYQAGKPIAETAREIGLDEDDIIKLASNENPIGVSKHVHNALLGALKDLSRYPDGNGFALKQALSEKHHVSDDMILLGNGSNDILELVSLGCLSPGASAVFSEYAFAVYPLMTQARGAESIVVPSKEFGHDLEAMLAAIRADTKLVIIANPNNPTGTYLPEASLRAFVEKVPSTVLVVIDEAYFDYIDPERRFDVIGWVREFSNLLISRTFSKAYGLAGLRVGYAIAHAELVSLLNRVRQPFNTNSLAQIAAIAALKDHGFVERTYEVNRLGKEQIYRGLSALCLPYIESHGNFVTFKIANALSVFKKLLGSGVIVRPLTGYGLADYLRVSIGLQTENDKFLQELGAIIEQSDS